MPSWLPFTYTNFRSDVLVLSTNRVVPLMTFDVYVNNQKVSTATLPPAPTDTDWAFATGGSLTGVTVMETVAAAEAAFAKVR